MNQQLPRLTFEQAKRAHSLGFDWPTKDIYCGPDDLWEAETYELIYETLDGTIPAPENAIFLQWCREVKGIYGAVDPQHPYSFQPVYTRLYGSWEKGSRIYQTYPEAESALIDQILTVLENDNKNN